MSLPFDREPLEFFVPHDEEVLSDGLWWINDIPNPYLKQPQAGFVGNALVHAGQTAKKLSDLGWPIFDDPGDYPDLAFANDFMLQIMRQYYPEVGTGFEGYINLDQMGIFDETNWNQTIHLVGNIGLLPNTREFPFRRTISYSLEAGFRDYPCPMDFNMVLISAYFRVTYRVKLCLQAARLGTFGKHGGRPRKVH